MSEWSWVKRLLTVGVVLLLLALVAGQLLGQPVGLSYVETDSMSPTLEPGDGFIAVPTATDNAIKQGDVIVFEAAELHGGGLTTHRIVERTERGYITRGDGNPFTDQDGDEPPVKEPQIVAKALQINGEVVVIPHLGTGIEGIQTVLEQTQRQLASLFGTSSVLGAQGLAYLFFVLTLVWYMVGEWRDRTGKHADRTTERETGLNTHFVVGCCAVLLMASATAAMVVPAGSQEYEIVSAEFDSDQPTVIQQGDSEEVTYPLDNGGLLPAVSYLEPASEGVDVEPHESYLQPQSLNNATATLQAPPETGSFRRYVVEYRYLAVLPTPIIRNLYTIHPWLPIVGINALIGIPFYLLGLRLLGTGRIRSRDKRSRLPLTTRLRRLLYRLY